MLLVISFYVTYHSLTIVALLPFLTVSFNAFRVSTISGASSQIA